MNKIINKIQIPPNSEEEIEIRAATVVAVDEIKSKINQRNVRPLHSIEVDWLLWQQGEARKDDLKPHHRTLTVFY